MTISASNGTPCLNPKDWNVTVNTLLCALLKRCKTRLAKAEVLSFVVSI